MFQTFSRGNRKKTTTKDRVEESERATARDVRQLRRGLLLLDRLWKPQMFPAFTGKVSPTEIFFYVGEPRKRERTGESRKKR